MTVVYMMNQQPQELKIWFENESDCWSVLMQNDSLYDQINAKAGWCEVSYITSKLIRPKIRPQN
mgnify:FL=1